MKFRKDEIIIPIGDVYPANILVVVGYENDGILLAHPVGGGLQYRLTSADSLGFRAVSKEEWESPLWRRTTFAIEGFDETFLGWTDGRKWNGWAMPYFEFCEAEKVVELLGDGHRQFIAEKDIFRTQGQDGDEDWEGRFITVLGGTEVKVYGIGAGSWIWDEIV